MQIEEIIQHLTISDNIPDRSYRLFIFGRNPVLSFAELQTMMHADGNDVQITDISPSGIIIKEEKKTPSVLQSGSLLKKAIPVSFLIKSADPTDDRTDIEAIADELIASLIIEDKCHWCISAYNEERDTDTVYFDLFMLAIRDALKRHKIKKCTFIPPDEELDRVRSYEHDREYQKHTVMPQKIHTKSILDNGFECVLWHRRETIIVCLTIEVIDIRAFEERDSNRPYTRPKLGLGGALARTMVNLARTGTQQVLYDPFCGTGIVLQEALLSGFHPVGSDIDENCIQGTRKNIQWISKKNKLRQVPDQNIFQLDVTCAASHFDGGSIPAIVTEPYLGPALKEYPSPDIGRKIISDLTRRYDSYLSALSPILAKDGTIVIIFPQIKTNDKNRHSIDIGHLLHKNRLALYHEPIDGLQVPYSFIHAPKGQRVERIICVLKKAAKRC